MSEFDVDLFVIGGGSGGTRAARIAAGHGARVMLAEEYRTGGTCVIRGCVPKKLFVYASRYKKILNGAGDVGWQAGPTSLEWKRLVGSTEAEALARDGVIDVEYFGLGGALLGNGRGGFLKLLIDQTTGHVVGVHIFGEHAGEMIQLIAIAVTAKLTRAVFLDTFGDYLDVEPAPTLSPRALPIHEPTIA